MRHHGYSTGTLTPQSCCRGYESRIPCSCRTGICGGSGRSIAAVTRTAWPWLTLALAAIAAFLSDHSGPEVGYRVMLLLIAAAIITAIQDGGRNRPHSPTPDDHRD